MGMGVGLSTNSPNPSGGTDLELPHSNLYTKCTLMEVGFRLVGMPEPVESEGLLKKKRRKGGARLGIKIGNPCLRRLISGAIAGAASRTSVAPSETIRTQLMVGSYGHSTAEVFQNIVKNEGGRDCLEAIGVNVIRVAPSKAMERGVHKNLFDAFVKIVREEGPADLHRGLTPSLIGVVPYAATNYFAYDTLSKAYKRVFRQEEIGNVATLLIGSAAGTISSSATIPLEVAR